MSETSVRALVKLAGLMRFRRDDPPELLPTILGDLGRILGAAEIAFDAFLTPAGMEAWKQSEGDPDRQRAPASPARG